VYIHSYVKVNSQRYRVICVHTFICTFICVRKFINIESYVTYLHGVLESLIHRVLESYVYIHL